MFSYSLFTKDCDNAYMSTVSRDGDQSTSAEIHRPQWRNSGKLRFNWLGYQERSIPTELGLGLLALLFVGAYTYEVLAEPTGLQAVITEIVVWGTWLAFAVDYFVRMWRSPNPKHWVLNHFLGLLLIVLPLFEALRPLRVVSLFFFVQRLLIAAHVRVSVLVYSMFSTALLIYTASLAVYKAEVNVEGSQISTFPEALWYSFVTVTTVGYGDITPHTLTGRLIALGLMLGGIALLGIVTATLASWLVDRVELTEENATEKTILETTSSTNQRIRSLEVEVAELRQDISHLIEITAKNSADSSR